jgi:hypothetical protein
MAMLKNLISIIGFIFFIDIYGKIDILIFHELLF